MVKIILFLLFLPKVTYANLGIPIVAINWASLIIFFWLVILIEFLFLKKISLSKLKILWYVFLANLKTTLLGIPIMYFFLISLQSIIEAIIRIFMLDLTYHDFYSNIFFALFLQPWVHPGIILELYGKTDSILIVYFIFTLMYIPAFYISYYVEYYSLKSYLKLDNNILLKKICFKANLLSYLLLFIIFSTILIYTLSLTIKSS